jgi:hypothetical protein
VWTTRIDPVRQRRERLRHGVRDAVPEHHVGRAQPRAELPALAEEGGAEARRQLLADRRDLAGLDLIEGADVEVDLPPQAVGHLHHGGLAAAQDDVGEDQTEPRFGHVEADYCT